MARRSSFDGACCCTISSFSRIMSRSGPRRPSGIVGTEGVASAGVGDEIEAYRVDMRFLILSSTRDLRAFLSGLDNLAAGFGPLRADEALLRRDCIVVVETEVVQTFTARGLMRTLSFPQRLVLMSRRSLSSSPPHDVKRPRLAGLNPDDYRNGVMLAPMVRSGARTSHSPLFSNTHLRRSSSYLQFPQGFSL